MSGVEQQPCCCDNLHPCCAGWDGPPICQYDVLGTSVLCEPFDNPEDGPGKRITVKGCFKSAQECREHFLPNAGPNFGISFYEDEPCPDTWPEDFCQTECTKPCFQYLCGQCGPYVAACMLIPCDAECDEGTQDCEPQSCCDPQPVPYCCCYSGSECNLIANCYPALLGFDGKYVCSGTSQGEECSLVADCTGCEDNFIGALGCCRSCNGVTFISGDFIDTDCQCYNCDDPAFPDGYAQQCAEAFGGNPAYCWSVEGPCNPFEDNPGSASSTYAGKDERKGYIVTENGAIPNTLFLFGYGVNNLK